MSHAPGHIDPPPPSHVPGHIDPPPPVEAQKEVFFPQTPFRIFPIELGLAFGLTAAVFMALAMLMAKFTSSNPAPFFAGLFSSFSSHAMLSVVAGLLLSWMGGFVIGVLTGAFYNLRLRRYVM